MDYMFFFISISFISIPEARFEKKISILSKLISILPRLRLKKILIRQRIAPKAQNFYENSTKISIWISIS